MSQDLKISKKVYDKEESNEIFNKGINYFSDSGSIGLTQQPTEVTQGIPSIEQFFIYYDQLFNEIPIEGSINTHRYLVNRSKALLPEETSVSNIQPLLDEIARLRRELLDANQQIIDLTINNSGV